MIKTIIKHKETVQIAKFMAVGLTCSIIFYVIFAALLRLHVQYQAASAIGYLSGTVASYFLNKLWTFKSNTLHSFTEIMLFIVVYLTALGVNLGMLTLLVSKWHMNKYVAQLFAIGTSAVFSYSGNRLLVFKKVELTN
jgi:putative flippase GtrA